MDKKIKFVKYLLLIVLLQTLSCKNSKYERVTYYNNTKTVMSKKIFENKNDYVQNKNYRQINYFKSGQRKEIFSIRNNKINGSGLQFYENGVLKEFSTNLDGNLHGVGKCFDASGNLTDEFLFLYNRMKIFKKIAYNIEDKLYGYRIFEYIDTLPNTCGSYQMDSSGVIIDSLSFYYEIKGSDTLYLHESNSFIVKLLHKYSPDFRYELLIGELDIHLNLKDTISVDRGILSNNEFIYQVEFNKSGINLLQGILTIEKDTILNDSTYSYGTDFVFYKQVFVIE